MQSPLRYAFRTQKRPQRKVPVALFEIEPLFELGVDAQGRLLMVFQFRSFQGAPNSATIALMHQDDELSLWYVGAVLKSSGLAIQSQVLDDIQAQVKGGTSLEEAVSSVQKFERRAGDSGIEIVGALLLPVLLEGFKQFWSTYVKKLSDQAADAAASATTAKLKQLLTNAFKDERRDELLTNLEHAVRDVCKRRGADEDEIKEILAIVKSPQVAHQLADGEK